MKRILRAILRQLLLRKVKLLIKSCVKAGHKPLAVHVAKDDFKPTDANRFGIPFVIDPTHQSGDIRIKTDDVWDEVMLAHFGE